MAQGFTSLSELSNLPEISSICECFIAHVVHSIMLADKLSQPLAVPDSHPNLLTQSRITCVAETSLTAV